MLSHSCRQELQNSWLPHITDCGLNRLIELLEKGSPLLIHGSFIRAVPQGCLATHIAWNHPKTEHLLHDAGIVWLSMIVGLNPSLSCVVRAWDASAKFDWQMRADLLEVFKENRQRRSQPTPCGQETPALVEV